jgi:hypothetical protein
MRVKNKSLVWYLNQIFFFLATGLSLYLFIDFLILRRSLPSGVCPVEKNRTLLYSALVFAFISLILSVIESVYKKSNQRN